jgi:acyl carrier protein
MVDVFISYKQEEREAVQIIAVALADLKLEVWFDTKLRAGGAFDEEIAAALRDAKAVLVCWTPAAVRSEWVRGEATEGLNTARLAACFLQPTNLVPPFNLTHAENLSAWASQADDPAWLKVLDRIGELVDRPGLATYQAVMRPGASIQEMRAWVAANGADPLVETVWARIALIEGEDQRARFEREKAEARADAERRKAQSEKSRRLARERGLRDPVRERRRFAVLTGSVAAVALLAAVAVVYLTDAAGRDRVLRDDVTTPAQARAFLADNGWHPISGPARQKFERLDANAWLAARTDGSISALEAYVADAQNTPQGNFLAPAHAMLGSARQVHQVQSLLARMRLYDGPASGTKDAATQRAIALFRYRRNMPVSADIDDALMQKLAEDLEWWTHPRLEELHATSVAPPSEADYVRLAQSLGVDAATIRALVEVETGSRPVAFDADGRMIITFEPTQFARLTQRRYVETHPRLSARSASSATQKARWETLAQAFALDPDAALKATSWGRLQILGMHHERAGYKTVGEFVRVMSQSEANQLEAGLLGFIRTAGYADALRRHDWAEFARRHYGNNYRQLRLDEKLSSAYRRIAAKMASDITASRASAPAQQPATAPVPSPPPPENSDAVGKKSEQENSATIAERVRKIVIERLGRRPEEVVPEAGFIDNLGADPDDTRDLVRDFEEEFGVAIPEAVARHLVTVGDVVRFIEKSQQSGAAK